MKLEQNINKIYPLILIILLLIFSYRDFLVTYRMMLLDEDFLYYHYQNIIIYYNTGDKNFADNLPMNARFLGLILQYIIFKTVPCLTLTNVNINPSYDQNFECATFSLALLNYILKYSIIVLVYFYTSRVLKRGPDEIILSIIFCFIFLNYIEAFTFDRLVIFYTLLILVFLNSRYISISLIILSFLVGEKVVMIIGPLLFIKIFLSKEKKYFPQFIASILTVLFYFLMIYFLKNNFNYNISHYYDSAGLHRLFLDFTNISHLSNSILPVIFCLLPYIIFFLGKKKFGLNFSGYEITLPLLMYFLGVGGGEHNLGRYAMHTFIVWLPLFVAQINYYFKFSKIFNEK